VLQKKTLSSFNARNQERKILFVEEGRIHELALHKKKFSLEPEL